MSSEILDLDMGNSRIKWRLGTSRGAGKPILQGVAENFQALFAALADRQPARVRVSSVRRGEALKELTLEVRQSWNLDTEVAQVKRSWQGLSVAYADLARLGVDRWLAMLAAFRQVQASVVVVDCGTALTVDLVDDSGQHRGGYIVPGLGLAPRALTDNTGIRLESAPAWAMTPGNSSEAAVYNGTLVMLVGLLEQVLGRQIPGLALGAEPALIFTGGDAALISSHMSGLPQETYFEPDLVLDGLAVALP